MEGYKEGKVIEVYPIIKVHKNKNYIIHEYYLKDRGWVSKAKCLELAKQEKVDVEICRSRLGNVYLRAKGNSSFQSDLGKLVEKKSKR